MDDNERKMLLLRQIDEKLGSINLYIQIIAAVIVVTGVALYFRH